MKIKRNKKQQLKIKKGFHLERKEKD